MRYWLFSLFIFAFICLDAGHALGQKYQWIKVIHDSLHILQSELACDSKGNIVISGQFDTHHLFGSSVSSNNYALRCSGNKATRSCYIAKYDTGGNLLWVLNTFPITGNDANDYLYNQISIDRQDNILICGRCFGNGNIYMAKYSPAGALLWRRLLDTLLNCDTFTRTSFYYKIYARFLDNGNILLSNAGSDDFDSVGGQMVHNYRSVFLAECDTNGKLVWAIKPYSLSFCASDSTKQFFRAPPIAPDHAGHFYMAGNYTAGVQIGASYYIGVGRFEHNFLACYDTADHLIWSKPIAVQDSTINTMGVNYDGLDESQVYGSIADFFIPTSSNISITAGPQQDIYMNGMFTGQAAFDTFNLHTTHIENQDVFVAKYNAQGQAQWAKDIRGLSDSCYIGRGALYVDQKSGYVYISFDVFPDDSSYPASTKIYFSIDGQIFFTNNRQSRYCIACFNPQGKCLFVKTVLLNIGAKILSGIATDYKGNLFLSGQFYGNNTFDSISVSGHAFNDFLAKLSFPINPVLPPDTISAVKTACITDSIYFHLKPGNAPDSVLWLFGDGSASTAMQPVHKYAKPGTYKVVFHSYFYQDDDTVSLQVTVSAPPVINLGGKDSVCATSLALNPAAPTGAACTWSTGAGTPSISVTASGKYWVQVSLGGCTVADTATVILLPPAVFKGDNLRNAKFCDKDSGLTLDAGIAYRYLWVPGGDSTRKITVDGTGIYSVIISAADGCTASRQAEILDQCPCYLFVPNVFSPNQDKLNDRFMASSGCLPQTYDMQVYNRWGELVFRTSDINQGWDGTYTTWDGIYKTPYCPEGVYIYKILCKFPNTVEQQQTGTVVVVRP